MQAQGLWLWVLVLLNPAVFSVSAEFAVAERKY